MSRKNRAFNLLELCIVISIIGVMYGVTYFMYSYLDITKKYHDTEVKLAYIENALISYFKKRKKLPCPEPILFDSNRISTDKSNINYCNYLESSQCSKNIIIYKDTYMGSLPVSELNLDYKMKYDAWGSKIFYAVDKKFLCSKYIEDTEGQKSNFHINDNFYLSEPTLNIKDNNLNIITNNAIYILISYGQNRHGAYNINNLKTKKPTNILELENLDLDDVFVSIDARITTKGVQDKYDDLVRFRTKQQLIIEADITNHITDNIKINSYFGGRECQCNNLTNNPDLNALSKKFCIN